RQRIFPPTHVTLAYTENSLGVAYNWLEDYEASLAHYQSAYNILQQNLRPSHTQLNQIKTNIAVLYEDLGLFWEALGLHRETLTYVEELEPGAQMAAYFNLASTLGVVGDAQEALFYLDRAEEIFEQYPRIHPLMKAKIQAERGGAYFSLGEIDKAMSYTQASVKETTTLLGADHEENIIEYIRLGNYLAEQKKFDLANQYFLRAIRIARKAYPKGNIIRGWAWEFYAENLLKQNQHVAGLSALDSAEVSYQVGGASWGLGDIAWKRAEAHRQLGDWEAAFAQYEAAWEIVLPEVPFQARPDERVWSYWDRFPLPYLLLSQAETYLQYGQLKEELSAKTAAWACLEAYLAVKDSHRHYYEAPDSKQQGIEAQREAVEKMLLLSQELDQQGEKPIYIQQAWTWAEKTKGAQLHQHIRSREALKFAGIPDSLIQKERYYRQRLAALSARSPEEAGYALSPDSQSQATLIQLRKAYRMFTDKLEKQFPQYYDLKYPPAQVDLASWSQTLPPSTQLYSYFWGRTHLFVCKIDPQTIQLYTVEDPALLDQWLSFINQPPSQGQLHTDRLPLLSQRLLPDLSPTQNRLWLIPDGRLGYLPFESLLLSPPQDEDFRRWDYLLHHYSCAYFPSLGLLMNPGTSVSTDAYQGWAPTFGAGQADPVRLDLAPLKFSQEEIHKTAQLLDGHSLLGTEAQETHFKQMKARAYILHFATHAIADEADLMRSRLYFAPSSDSVEDGVLYAHELYGMEIQSPLVVLSACQTAKGPLRQGEGIMSLACAFRYAGASR
ncbi:MAG: CHAT domain-containing protein, partial [Bacteroidota bacterium]